MRDENTILRIIKNMNRDKRIIKKKIENIGIRTRRKNQFKIVAIDLKKLKGQCELFSKKILEEICNYRKKSCKILLTSTKNMKGSQAKMFLSQIRTCKLREEVHEN